MALTYKEIFEYNEKWVNEQQQNDPDFFHKMSLEQKPEYLFIGCSDSRADPQDITGLGLGEVFVHRNVANIVNPIDLNVASVIEYAIENLKVKHIILCGHYGCGGVEAAMKHKGLGKNSPWLQIIKDIYRIHENELEKIKNEDKRYNRLVELNVIEQTLNVFKMDYVQERIGKKDCPSVHGWVYDMRSGRIIDLEVDPEKEFGIKKGLGRRLLKRVSSWFRRPKK